MMFASHQRARNHVQSVRSRLKNINTDDDVALMKDMLDDVDMMLESMEQDATGKSQTTNSILAHDDLDIKAKRIIDGGTLEDIQILDDPMKYTMDVKLHYSCTNREYDDVQGKYYD